MKAHEWLGDALRDLRRTQHGESASLLAAELEREIATVQAHCGDVVHISTLLDGALRRCTSRAQHATAVETVVLHTLRQSSSKRDTCLQALQVGMIGFLVQGITADGAMKIFDYAIACETWTGGGHGDDDNVPVLLEYMRGREEAAHVVSYDAAALHRLLHHCDGCRSVIAVRCAAACALWAALPRFFELAPEMTSKACIQRLLQRQRQQDDKYAKLLYRMLSVTRPQLLALCVEHSGQARQRTRLAHNCRLPWLRGAHPCVFAAALCGPRATCHKPVNVQHMCAEERCRWWAGLCVCLLRQQQRRRQLGVAAAATNLLCGERRSLLTSFLVQAGRFSELVRLWDARVITRVELSRIALSPAVIVTAAMAPYGAGDVARALGEPVPEACDTQQLWPCTAQRVAEVSRSAAATFVQHAVFLWAPPARWPRTLRWPLPQWTPDTHRVLYFLHRRLRTAVRVLFLVHELRPHSVLASLPYELLFHLFHCTAAVFRPGVLSPAAETAASS